jgi:hypothetical protein
MEYCPTEYAKMETAERIKKPADRDGHAGENSSTTTDYADRPVGVNLVALSIDSDVLAAIIEAFPIHLAACRARRAGRVRLANHLERWAEHEIARGRGHDVQ